MRNHFHSGLEELGARWGWYLAVGIVLVALGASAATFAYATTVASVVVFGWVLLVAGVVLGTLSALISRWSGFLLSALAAILSMVTGVAILRAPLLSAEAISLLVASYLLVSGIFRAVVSGVMRLPNWGWSLLGGIVTAVLGSLLLSGWPASGLWFIGFYVGIDLVSHGLAWCVFALSLRSSPAITSLEVAKSSH
jgi:uncharacterized membrane protein HdeD (DUF308 family)